MLKRVLSWCSAALVAATVIVVPTSAAHAALPAGWHYIKNVNSGWYLSTVGGSGANGAEAVQWTFNGNLDQQWQLNQTVLFPGHVRLRSATTWRRLGIAGASTVNGARAVLWDQNDSRDQLWYVEQMGGGEFRLINNYSAQCLGVRGASLTRGAAVVQWPCNGSADQRWYPTS